MKTNVALAVGRIMEALLQLDSDEERKEALAEAIYNRCSRRKKSETSETKRYEAAGAVMEAATPEVVKTLRQAAVTHMMIWCKMTAVTSAVIDASPVGRLLEALDRLSETIEPKPNRMPL